MKLKCEKCSISNDSREWLSHTAMEVVGYPGRDAVGNIESPVVREDYNYFWVCPHCDKEVRGKDIVVIG